MSQEHRFKTKAEAVESGYRLVVRHGPNRDKDVSGHNSFGYDFEDAEGNRTVTVWFSEETNQGKTKGAFLPMFPPKQEATR